MKATAFEFRFRFLIHFVLILLGFTGPWDRFLNAEAGRTVWLVLAAWPARNHWLSFSAATITLLIMATLCALAAAALRTWGSAYLGASVVNAHTMQGYGVVAAGPYRYLRNPLYLGTIIHVFALALLMPPSGAIFCIVTITIFQLRLIAAEESFLAAKLGEPYLAYCARVSRLIPALTPRVPASATAAAWPSAFLGETYMWGVLAAFVIAGYRYNAFLITQGVLIALGVSLIARAFLPKR
jgi:protein-S-isoprenylcysteine O-methyltransferase Ste14